MNNSVFEACMVRLMDHFGKRLKDTAEYGQALTHVPDEAFEEICRSRIWDNAPIPSKFPTIRDLLDDWHKWLKDHPDKQAPVRWVFCPYCEPYSPGLIRVKIPIDSPDYTRMGITHRDTMVRCRYCENSQQRNPMWPRYNYRDMEEMGWEILTEYHEREDEEDIPTPAPGMEGPAGLSHIERSLPAGDRDMDDSDIPF